MPGPDQERKAYTVFISSTFIDNRERRKLVEDAILRAGMMPVGMERFTASAHATVEECERPARECEIYLGIVAHRYGWIPEGKTVSITELEYEAAKAAGRPRLMFEIDKAILINQDADYDQGPDRWAKQEKLDAFRRKFREEQMSTPFTETHLGVKVLQALNRWREERESATPSSSAASPPAPPLAETPELARYREAALSLHANLPLAGFKTKLRVPIDLEELYVPLSALADLRAVGDRDFADAEDAATKMREQGALEIPLAEAFREARKRKRQGLVILGDPGSGKTTHLKRLLLACLRAGPASLGLPPEVLPAFLPLRDLEDLAQGVDAFIEKTLADPHLALPEGFGRRLLERGHLLLLFDGLDEVSDPAARAKVSRWLERAARARPNCTVVVTCRFAGYGEDARLGPEFLELHLRPLTPEQSESFIRNWYRAVETGLALDPAQGEIDAARRAEELAHRLREPDFRAARMAEMTRNPLLLANLCLVHRDRGALPRNRRQLYEECVEVLLERWREAKSLPVRVSAELGQRALQPAALWLHGETGRARAAAAELAPALAPALQAARWPGGDAAAFLRAVRDESGLLTGWGPDRFGFMHLGFQEYLAAAELRRLAFEGDKRAAMRELAGHCGESWWQEVILLLLAQGNPSLFAPFMREALELPGFDALSEITGLILEEAAEASAQPFLETLQQAPDAGATPWRKHRAALRLLERLLPEAELQALALSLSEHPAQALRDWARARTRNAAQTVRVSAHGGVELVLIPGGRFFMGSPPGKGNDSERPRHEVQIRPFYLGRYPVTNEEYARFLAANPGAKEPKYWGDRQFNQARQPAVGVDWEEACRFCAWAGGRLPSEAEWEYAARAGTTTEYWWGEEIGTNRANARDSGSRWSDQQTSPVGSFAANPFGLHDTAGNAWEWTMDVWHENYRGAPADGVAWLTGGDGGLRVIRGGSWNGLPVLARSAHRDVHDATFRGVHVGFRLAQDL
jgi:formylglycine-generating enzyme required for sulfatase activity